MQWLLCAFLIVSNVGARSIEKDRAVFYTKEIVNGSTFEQRREWIEGSYREKCYIDEVAVSSHEYEDAVLQAEYEEIRQRRAREREHNNRAYTAPAGLRARIFQRLLGEYYTTILEYVSLLQKYDLESSLVLKHDTIPDNETYTYICSTLLHQARVWSEQSAEAGEVLDTSHLSHLCQEFEDYMPRIKQVYFDTVQAAIDSCTDTKRLKELLTLVS